MVASLIFVAFLVLKAPRQLIAQSPENCNSSLSLSVTVDLVNGQDCSLSRTLQHNQSCSNLQDTLSVTSRLPVDSCLEIIVNQGTYDIEGTLVLSQNLLISGREGHNVIVHLRVESSDTFQYSLSFRNASRVQLQNLEFVGTSGIIGFDNVNNVGVHSCSFR